MVLDLLFVINPNVNVHFHLTLSCGLLRLTFHDSYTFFEFSVKVKTIDLARTRTWNPLIRSQMPYPLGRKAVIKGLRLNRHTMCNEDFHQKLLKEILVANSSN